MSETNVQALIAAPLHFRKWLEGQAPSAVAGKTTSPCDCPLARFLHEHNCPTAVVLDDYIKVSTQVEDGKVIDRATLQHPRWVAQFIAAVDEHESDVTAEQCLSILAREVTP
jgi:hypothetical protein